MGICLLFPMFGAMRAHAADGEIRFSDHTGTKGSTVTVTCTIKCNTGGIGYADLVLLFDTVGLEYVDGSGGYGLVADNVAGSIICHGLFSEPGQTTLTFTMKFKIINVGTYKITVSYHEAFDIDENAIVLTEGSSTIVGKLATVVQPDNQKDSNSKLSSLQVYPGTLAPKFNASIMSYNLYVDDTVKDVTIAAKAQSSKATVAVSGGKDLKRGANAAQVIVTAENGSTSVYNINIMRGEDVEITVGGSKYTIDDRFTDEQIPSGFTRSQITYNGKEYEGLKNKKGNMELICLKDDSGSQFYIYNKKTQEFFHFTQILLGDGKYIVPLPLKTETEEFKDNEIVNFTVQDKMYDAWKINGEFSVLHVMNQDGEEVLYRYDHTDGAFQRYIKEKPVVQSESKGIMFPNRYYQWAIYGLGGLTLILLISLVYFIASRKKRHEARKKKAYRAYEKQKIKEEKILFKAERAADKQKAKDEVKRYKEEVAADRQYAKDKKASDKQRAKDAKESEKQRARDEKAAEKQRQQDEKDAKKQEKQLAKEAKKMAKQKQDEE